MPLENEKIEVAEEKETEMPNVEELLKILLDVNLEQNRQTVHLLMNYMNDIEENFFSVLEELDTVKAQLAQVQQIPQTKEVRHTLSDLIQNLQGQANHLQEQIHGMKTRLNEKAAQLVQNFKDQGVTALNHVCEFLGVKESLLLGCWICSCLIDLLVLVLSTAIGNLLPASIVGYGFILFQYGAFLLLALSVGNLVTKIFFWSGYLENLNGIFNPVQWLLIVILPMILLAVCTSFFVKAKYIRGYLNTQNFQYRRTDKAIAPTKIQNPYFLLEWKRVSRNKELIFFSNIKNILTVFVLFSLLVQNFEWIGLSEKYALELFLLVSCCAVNTISSTAYSSDPNKSYFSFLPISAHRLFFWKTIQGFLWGELTVLLFGVGVILFRNIPILDACLLLGYGTATNYSCVWIGVFLDYKMPRTPNSTNELLHGNISKVLVLFVSIALTVWEIYFSTQISGSISLLLFAVCISVCIVMIELGYLIFYRRAFRD